MRKFEKEFRLQHPETIGETDKDFDNYNYTEFLESVLEKMAQPKEEQPEKIVREEINTAKELFASIIVSNAKMFSNENLNREQVLEDLKTDEPFKLMYKLCLEFSSTTNELAEIKVKELKSELEKANELIKELEESRKNFAIGFGKFITDNKYGSTEGNYNVILNDYIESLTKTK